MHFCRFIAKRILQTIPLLIIVSLISFFIIRLSPIDPLAELRLNPSISQETLNKEIKRLNLDKPIGIQYLSWAKSFVKGDLGYTSAGEKVSVKLKERIPNTLLLTLVVIFMTWSVGIPLGIASAVNKESSFDRLLTILSSIGMAIPSFFFAILMLIFAVKTGWFPVGGLTSYNFNDMNFWGKGIDIARHIVLPALVLFTISLSGLQRQMRANMLEVLDSDYIKFARAKGLSEDKVIYRHAFRNTMIPLVTLLAGILPSLFGGMMITEQVFGIDGIGRLAYLALKEGDVPFVMGYNMFLAILTVIGTLLSDIMYSVVDPRVKLGK